MDQIELNIEKNEQQTTEQSMSLKPEENMSSIIQADTESNVQSVKIRRSKLVKSISNISHDNMTQSQPLRQVSQFSKDNIEPPKQQYSKTIMNIFQTINSQRKHDTMIGSQFTTPFTQIRSIKDFHFQTIQSELQASVFNNQFSRSNKKHNTTNFHDIIRKIQNNHSNVSTQQSQMSSLSTITKDQNTSLDVSKERQKSSQLLTRSVLNLSRQQSEQTSRRTSITCSQINSLNSISKMNQTSKINFNISRKFPALQVLTNNSSCGKLNDMELKQSYSVPQNFSTQQTDEVKTPSSSGSIKRKQTKNCIFKSYQNSQFLTKAKKISTLNDLANEENQRTYDEQNNSQDKKEDEQEQNEQHSDSINYFPNTIVSLSNFQNQQDMRYDNTLTIPSIEQQLKLYRNKSQGDISEESTPLLMNKSQSKIIFKKAQIFQTKKNIKTKEIKVYDDTLQMQKRSSKFKNEIELIQLPFYRKKLVEVPNSKYDSKSTRQLTQERNQTEQSDSLKNNSRYDYSLQKQQTNDQIKYEDSASAKNKISQNNSEAFQFYAPKSQFKSLQEIEFKNKQMGAFQTQKKANINQGVKLSQIKQTLNQYQNDSILDLIQFSTNYSITLQSKHSQNFSKECK